ncbi:MAG: murein transglycosylase [Merismopedia sp. SIO2A8]|nr:murein transglycosylase [Merismopedia sp. SIO2A8]
MEEGIEGVIAKATVAAEGNAHSAWAKNQIISENQITTETQSTEPEGLPLQAIVLDNLVQPDLGLDGQLFNGENSQENGEGSELVGNRAALLQAIDYSLAYLRTSEAADVYRTYPVPGISRDRVRRSLVRFRELLLAHTSAEALQAAVLEEFEFYQSVGNDGAGTVEFTGYFAPTYTASRIPTDEYRYPLYRLPAGLEAWVDPHPTRAELEGANGIEGHQGLLQGLELVWMRDRLEAFLVQVQGSARLQLTDGGTLGVGYAGRTNYPYTSIGRLLINDGKFSEEELSLPVVLEYFRQHPADLDYYLPQNNRFVFFQLTGDSPPMGSLSQPVTRDRSIATDKSIMPPGALALIHTELPVGDEFQPQQISRYVLDQDTGGAIQGPGRVDIFMGIGEEAGLRAGLTYSTGHLYYLLLKP